MNDAEAAFMDVMQERLTGNEIEDEIIRLAAETGEILGLPFESIRLVAQSLITKQTNAATDEPVSTGEVGQPTPDLSGSELPTPQGSELPTPQGSELPTHQHTNAEPPTPASNHQPKPPIESGSPSGNAPSVTPRQSATPMPDRFQADLPPAAEASHSSANPDEDSSKPPRLLVDWGQELCIGHQACPAFSLQGLAPTATQPFVEVQIDERLDHQQNAEKPRLTPGEAGLWQFDVPFALTTAGADCRPGRYRLEIRVVQQSTVHTSARCYVCTLRLKVGEPGSAGGPSLEIEGDGQSVVNVQGSDLSGFANVKFKGADTSVLNFQSSNALQPAEQPIIPANSDGTNSKLCEYRFSIDEQRQSLLPKVSARFISRVHLRSASLQFDGGEQILLISKANVFLGRAKTNDIATRFLPRSTTYDRQTRDISRQHLSIRMSEEGVHIADLGSTKGVSIDGVRVDESRLLTDKQADEDLELLLSALPGPSAMGLELKMLSVPHEHDQDQAGCGEWRDLLCCDALKVRQPKSWRLAQSSGIDAVRLRRTRNLAGQEQYIIIGRQAVIGYSEDAAIYIPDPRVHRSHARILYLSDGFWIENLSSPDHTIIDGQPVPRGELVPLSPGMQIELSGVRLRFEDFEQLHMT